LKKYLHGPPVRDVEKVLERNPYSGLFGCPKREMPFWQTSFSDAIKYKNPHSKTLEAFLTGGLMLLNFKELKR